MLRVLEAFTGDAYELECSPGTAVESLQAALATLCGLPAADQLLLAHGLRLAPGRLLADYGLPGEGGAAQAYLYSRCGD